MKYLTLIAICCATLLSGIILRMLVPEEITNFEEFALGPGTASYFARHEGYPVHLDSLNQQDVDSLVAGWHLRGENNVAFLLGNSQMHGINQYVPGQENYSQILFDSLSKADYDILAQSVPNANLQEFLYMYRFWRQKVHITELIVPVFFDDMREDGIRFSYLHTENDSILLTETSEPAIAWNNEVKKDQARSAGSGDNAALNHTVQESVERTLSATFERSSKTWRSRPDIRGQLFTNLFLLRNRIFRIKPQSIRKVIPALYEKNFSALKLLVESAGQEHIPVLLYVPPIRSDISIPYDISQYEEFKKAVAGLANQHELVSVKNLESIVEGKYWGVKESTTMGSELEYDFMHFSYEGHKVLAHALQKEMSFRLP